MGRYRSVMPGAPLFAEGEELVLFLAADARGTAHLLGLGQGVFRLMTDRASGMRLVVPEILATVSTGPAKVVRGDVTRRPMLLEQFAGAVRTALLQQGAR